jgi:Rv2525c-like, glycoside hydrolase-like domain
MVAYQTVGNNLRKKRGRACVDIGFPQGINVWLDLEGVKPSTSHGVVIDYCNAWIAEVASAGFVPGVYVGAKAVLTGEEIFWRLQTKHFWRSGSKVPDIPHRRYQLIQKIIRGDNIGGIDIDRNLTVNDNLGQSVLWLSQKPRSSPSQSSLNLLYERKRSPAQGGLARGFSPFLIREL